MRVFILLRERGNNGAPGVLHLFLAADAFAKPCKLHPTQNSTLHRTPPYTELHPTQNSILLAGIVHPRIVTGIAVQTLYLECD
jgi:hypothetical protein